MVIDENVYQQRGALEEDKELSIALVRPAILYSAKTYSAPVIPPLGLTYIAGVLEKANYQTQVVDGLGADIDRFTLSKCGRFKMQGAPHNEVIGRISPNTDIVGVSAMYSQEWPHIKSFIKELRQKFPKAKIIMGGEHATALPEYSLRDCPEIDYIISGEGEFPFLELVHSIRHEGNVETVPNLHYLDQGRYLTTELDSRVKNLDIIPWPAWHLIDLKAYFKPNFTMGVSKGRNIPLIASRGCPYRCTFCSNEYMWTTKYYMRSPQDVVDEIEFYKKEYNVESIDFTDLTAIVKKEWVMEFSSEIKKRNLDLI